MDFIINPAPVSYLDVRSIVMFVFRCIDGHCDVEIGGPGKKCMTIEKELAYTKTFGSSPQLTLNGSVNAEAGLQLRKYKLLS